MTMLRMLCSSKSMNTKETYIKKSVFPLMWEKRECNLK